jgi:hypothetical protein
MTLGGIDVKPQRGGVVLGGILRHQAVFVLVDIGNELNLRDNFNYIRHKKKKTGRFTPVWE